MYFPGVYLILTGVRLILAGVHRGGGSGAPGGAGQNARPDVLPRAQAAPYEQDQVKGVKCSLASFLFVSVILCLFYSKAYFQEAAHHHLTAENKNTTVRCAVN